MERLRGRGDGDIVMERDKKESEGDREREIERGREGGGEGSEGERRGLIRLPKAVNEHSDIMFRDEGRERWVECWCEREECNSGVVIRLPKAADLCANEGFQLQC